MMDEEGRREAPAPGADEPRVPGTGAPSPAAPPVQRRPVPPPEVPGSRINTAPPGPPPAPRAAAPSAAPPLAGGGVPPVLPYSPTHGAGTLGDPRPETEPRGALRPAAAWGWQASLAGLAAGFGPELLLLAASLGFAANTPSSSKVTTGSAAALVVISLIVYGWHTLAAWFFSVRVAGRRLSVWGFRLPTRAFFWTVPVGLAIVYVVSILHDVVVHPRQQELIGEFPRTPAGVVLFVILAVVLAPLFEEIFFRGFLFRGLAASWGWTAGMLVSAGVFGLVHAQLDVFVPLFTLGLVLAWVYKRTGSLWTSISLHALFNGISVLAWALTG